MVLGEITPAEKARMRIAGPDKTTTPLQNATMSGTALPQHNGVKIAGWTV